MRIVAIYRQDAVLPVLDGGTRVEPGDEVFVLAATEHIRAVLQATGGVRGEAARRLGVDRTTLYRLMQKYGIEG